MAQVQPRLWVYKCNVERRAMQIAAGDWDDFFGEPQPSAWGGSDTMRNKSSLSILRNKAAVGDLVLAWQTNRKEAVGLCRIHELQDWTDENGVQQRTMVLNLIGEPFSPAVRLLDIRKSNAALARVRAFRPGYPATLYETSAQEARTLLKVCRVSAVGHENSKGAKPGPRSGSGFGTPVQNAKVEAAGIRAFKRKYRHWTLTDLQKDNVGYDFVATLRNLERHVEIKGAQGPAASFPITDNEVMIARSDPLWHLCVVTKALGAAPVIMEWTRDEFLRAFILRPVTTYIARLKN
jgi:hypothetical protein